MHLPDAVTTQAQALVGDWRLFLIAGLGVAAIVYGLILWPLLVSRRKDDRLPPQFSKNTPLEITYTVIPLLIVAGLFVYSSRVEGQVEQLTPAPDQTVEVTAFRWSWRFVYPRYGIEVSGTPAQPPQLVLPAGETTRIDLTSADVNHAFWVPAFWFKRDAIRGIVNHFDLAPQRLGVYRGECAEFCGLDHAHMVFTVRVVSAAEFQQWMRAAVAQGQAGG